MEKILIFFSIMLLVACKDKPVTKPDVFIEKDVMVEILYDITLLQAAENTNTAILSQEGVEAGDFIYKKYNIDSTTFAQNNRYYAADPNTYKKIFGEVYHRIELKQKEMAEKTGKVITTSDAPAIQ